MKKISILTLALLLTLTASAQVVRSGSTQKIRVTRDIDTITTSAIGLVGGLAQQFSLTPFGQGTEVGLDLQHKLGQHSRLDIQLGMNRANKFINNTYIEYIEEYYYPQWLSGQLTLGDQHRSRTSSVGLSATYQYVLYIVGGWNCYAGAGVSLSFDKYYAKQTTFNQEHYWSWIHDESRYGIIQTPDVDEVSGQGLTAGLIGVVGTEYRFRAPLTLSFDIRPWYRSVAFGQGIFGLSYQLGLRYTF